LDYKPCSLLTELRAAELREINPVAPKAVYIGKSVLAGKKLITVLSVYGVVQMVAWRADW